MLVDETTVGTLVPISSSRQKKAMSEAFLQRTLCGRQFDCLLEGGSHLAYHLGDSSLRDSIFKTQQWFNHPRSAGSPRATLDAPTPDLHMNSFTFSNCFEYLPTSFNSRACLCGSALTAIVLGRWVYQRLTEISLRDVRGPEAPHEESWLAGTPSPSISYHALSDQLIGDIITLFTDTTGMLGARWAAMYGTVVRLRAQLFTKNALLIADPAALHHILQSEHADKFVRAPEWNVLADFLAGECMGSSEWGQTRTACNPAFGVPETQVNENTLGASTTHLDSSGSLPIILVRFTVSMAGVMVSVEEALRPLACGYAQTSRLAGLWIIENGDGIDQRYKSRDAPLQRFSQPTNASNQRLLSQLINKMVNNLLAAMTVVACMTAALALPAPVPRGFFLPPFGFPMAGQGLSMPGLSLPSSGSPGFPGMPFGQGFTGAGFPGFWPSSGSSGTQSAATGGATATTPVTTQPGLPTIPGA
ncbi:hypothetical protein NMY22_g17564 [Coprinellus aureogranulatus]|nr:hypothetical protein NMY22_g17564 [Coprinellus aureogranulatus]